MSEKLPSLRIGELESELPIILGGMSTHLTGSELAGAVANEGGFGTLGGVGLGMSESVRGQREYFKANQDLLKKGLREALEISNDGNIGVNLMVVATDYEDMVKTAVENRAKYIVSGAGLPLSLPESIEKYKKAGQKGPELIPIVSSVRAAELILKKWRRSGSIPSAFVVETPNSAGGHLGVTKPEDIYKDEFSLETVIPKLVRFLKERGLDIPVIGAGGIWGRGDIDSMLSLSVGAKGVQMATRFIASDECNASQVFKDKHVDNREPIVIIKSPVGMPGRAIESQFVHKVNNGEAIDLGPCVNCLKVCAHRDNKLASYCIVRSLNNVRIGDVENGVLFTGSNGYLLKSDREKDIHSTRQIIQDLIK